MSEATLTSLLEYLYGALSPGNQRWLAERLMEHADTEECEALTPYTIEELHRMVAEGEQQMAEGKWQDSEEMFNEIEKEFANEELQLA